MPTHPWWLLSNLTEALVVGELLGDKSTGDKFQTMPEKNADSERGIHQIITMLTTSAFYLPVIKSLQIRNCYRTTTHSTTHSKLV